MCSELFIVVVVLTACVGYMYQCVVIVVSATRCIDGRRLVRLALVLALCWKHSDVEVVVRGPACDTERTCKSNVFSFRDDKRR